MTPESAGQLLPMRKARLHVQHGLDSGPWIQFIGKRPGTGVLVHLHRHKVVSSVAGFGKVQSRSDVPRQLTT